MFIAACCLLFVVCALCVAGRALLVECWLMFVVVRCSLLFVVRCCLLWVECWLMFRVCCLWYDVRCLF